LNIPVEKIPNDFNNSFKNYCACLPIYIGFKTNDIDIDIMINLFDSKKTIKYAYDFMKSKKENIYNIILKISKYFPVFTLQEYEDIEMSIVDINDKISSGEISLNDITGRVYRKIVKKEFQIVKIDLKKDYIIAQNNNIKYIFKCKIPVTLFIRKLFTDRSFDYQNKIVLRRELNDKSRLD